MLIRRIITEGAGPAAILGPFTGYTGKRKRGNGFDPIHLKPN
jgi:hypothetical protein